MFNIRMKCLYLLELYEEVENEMPFINYKNCCKNAVSRCNKQGWKIKSEYTLLKWQQQFRERDLLPNPLQERSRKEKLPPFLRDEDIANALRVFARTNLATLSAESAIDYVFDTLIPQLMMAAGSSSRPDEEEAPIRQSSTQSQLPTEEEKKEFLKGYGLTCLHESTMYRWLRALGFRYQARKKYYFVDGHETKDTKQYRKSYVKEMLELEKGCTGGYK